MYVHLQIPGKKKVSLKILRCLYATWRHVCVCVCNPVIIIIKIIIEGCDDDIIKWNLLACF